MMTFQIDSFVGASRSSGLTSLRYTVRLSMTIKNSMQIPSPPAMIAILMWFERCYHVQISRNVT